MKSEILAQLRESRDYISGQQLCDLYGVSRTAVWKVMEQLKKEGYQIKAVRNKGYCLVKSPDVMSEAEIKSLLHTEWAGKEVVCFKETDSTNMQAKSLGEKGAPHGTLVISDSQYMGKGRRGRAWESPSGSGIYMTILLRPSMQPAAAPMLTLVMALSVARAVRNIGMDAKIKWPNDLVIDGKKICGILTEMNAEVDYIHYVVIGAGINVHEQALAEELKERATSLEAQSNQTFRRSALVAAILKEFEKNYELFYNSGDLCVLMDDYNELLVNCNRHVRVLEPSGEYEGIALGINSKGELLVRKADGKECAVFAGEVSVRGIYGYV